jgi:hypothetical protein
MEFAVLALHLNVELMSSLFRFFLLTVAVLFTAVYQQILTLVHLNCQRVIASKRGLCATTHRSVAAGQERIVFTQKSLIV